MKSIKTKLVLVISLLIIVLFSAAAYVLIREKQREFTQDIFFESRTFAELTADKIVDDYKLYLSQGGFVYFNREMSELFQRTQDINRITVSDFNGTLLFDSDTEKNEQYQGPTRKIQQNPLYDQSRAHNPSLFTEDGQLFFLKKTDEGALQFVDNFENPIEPIGDLQRVSYFVFPIQDEFAVTYYLDYTNLDRLIWEETQRIMLLAALGILLGILTALVVAKQITKPIKTLTESSAIIATGNFKHRVNIKTKDELHTLGDAFNKMAIDLERSTKALIYKQRVAKELELAQKIQRELIPKKIPQPPGLDISAGLVPAEEIGGDLYDFLQRDEHNLMFYLGDVTGHGVPSGLLSSIANAMFFNLIDQPDIREIMVDVNKVIKAKSPANMFITLCLLNWNAQNKELSYVNAGHEQMVHFNKAAGKADLLAGGGIALGMFPDADKMLKTQVAPFEVGDCIIMYSDGIPEAWRNAKEQYGMERFQNAVAQYGNLPTALEIRNAILTDVKNFMGNYKQADDITIVVLKRIE